MRELAIAVALANKARPYDPELPVLFAPLVRSAYGVPPPSPWPEMAGSAPRRAPRRTGGAR